MSYRLTRLDSALNPVGEVARLVSADVSRDITGASPLIESATFEIDGGLEPGWHRLEWRDASLHLLGVFRVEADSATWEKGHQTVKAKGYSILKPAEESTLESGACARAGIDGAAYVRQLLSVCPGRVVAHGGAALSRNVVFDSGSTRLKAAWDVLDAMGWRLRIDGDGTVNVEPLPDALALDLSDLRLQDGIGLGEELDYSREFVGDVFPGDLVRLSVPQAGIDATLRVLTQDIACGNGCEVSETIGEWGR